MYLLHCIHTKQQQPIHQIKLCKIALWCGMSPRPPPHPNPSHQLGYLHSVVQSRMEIEKDKRVLTKQNQIRFHFRDRPRSYLRSHPGSPSCFLEQLRVHLGSAALRCPQWQLSPAPCCAVRPVTVDPSSPGLSVCGSALETERPPPLLVCGQHRAKKSGGFLFVFILDGS